MRSRRETPVAVELRELAREVRRIGDGWRSDPEAIAMQKDDVAERLRDLARRLELAA
ncbi:MAG: hypothetical protein OHK0024_24090 [Thalassobaculales bacterium]